MSFRFAITVNTESQDINLEPHQCTCLMIYSELDSMGTWVNNSIRFHPTSNIAPITSRAAPTTNTDECTGPIPEVVENLCSHLQKLDFNSALQKEYLGIIQGTSTIGYRNLIYRDPDQYPATSKVSLSTILTDRDKHGLFPRDLCLKTALLLSCSLLQFRTSQGCWFQDRWRAQDIFFFLNRKHYSVVLHSTLTPYIEAFFPKPSKDKSLAVIPTSSDMKTSIMPPATLSRNEKLFSLALVLIEIAFGKSIFNLTEPSGLSGETQNEFVEYIKVKGIIDSHMLVGEMGSRYAAVVKRCFYCDFGIDEEDLAKKEVQKVFYEKIVLELEHCLETFRGS